jgi:hypothetical protein
LKTKEIKSIRCELGIDANGKFWINDYIAYKNSPYIKYSLNEFLEKISYEGFLKLSFEKRLEAVTEWNIKLEDVLNWKVKNIRFSFPFKELENKVKLDDLIPKELTVWQWFNVYSWNDNGYFSRTKIPKVNKSKKTPDNNRIKIQNWTELSFEKPNFRDKIKVDWITPEELDKILHLDFYPITKNKFGKETEILFRCALQIAWLPEEWATSKEFAQLIWRESVASTGKGNERGLKVWVLNHTIKWETTESFKRKAVESSKKQNPIGSKSTASWLWQLLLYNVDIYYPDWREGIWDPLNEAVWMVRYIAAAYNNPKNALKFHLEHNYY